VVNKKTIPPFFYKNVKKGGDGKNVKIRAKPILDAIF